jgi:hypothetical protein
MVHGIAVNFQSTIVHLALNLSWDFCTFSMFTFVPSHVQHYLAEGSKQIMHSSQQQECTLLKHLFRISKLTTNQVVPIQSPQMHQL